MAKRLAAALLLFIFMLSLLAGCAADKAANPPLASLGDLDGKRIGVYTGTIYDKWAVEHYPNATILRYNSPSDMIMAIKSGKIDAAINTATNSREIIKANPDIGILTEDVLEMPLGIGFSKDNPPLKDKFNTYLNAMKQDGSLDALYKKWFTGDIEKVVMPDYESFPEGETLILGVATGDLPNVGYVNGQYVGFDIELIHNFAQQEHINLEIISMEFSSLVAALAAGKVDIITDGIAITEERQKQVDFSDPIMVTKSAVIALKVNIAQAEKSTTDNFKLDDLAHMKVGVLQGSVHDDYMREHYPGSDVLQYKSYPDLILAVKSGKVDAGFQVKESFLEVQKNDPSLIILADNVFKVPIAMGFNQENDLLREQFNAFLKEIKANGVYDDMVKRWYQDQNYTMPHIDNPAPNGQIRIGNVSDKGIPFTAVIDNQLVGFDIEFDQRFAAFLGKEPVFIDMEFGNLIAAISTNKIDMITSTMMITEERKKQIDFSDPYYELSVCVFGSNKALAASDASSFTERMYQRFYSNMIIEDRYLLVIDGLKTTGIISIFSILLGTILGAIICWLRMSRNHVLQLIARIYISILRGIPVLVFLMIIYYVVFGSVNISAVLVAIVAFSMNFAAYVSEMFRMAIQSIDRGQSEAGIAGGFTKAQTFIYIVMPQAIRQVLPVYQGELISLVKMTSIVGYIAVQDLTKAGDIIRSRTFDAFFPLILTAILYFAISWLLIWLLDAVQKSSDPKRKRKTA